MRAIWSQICWKESVRNWDNWFIFLIKWMTSVTRWCDGIKSARGQFLTYFLFLSNLFHFQFISKFILTERFNQKMVAICIPRWIEFDSIFKVSLNLFLSSWKLKDAIFNSLARMNSYCIPQERTTIDSLVSLDYYWALHLEKKNILIQIYIYNI